MLQSQQHSLLTTKIFANGPTGDFVRLPNCAYVRRSTEMRTALSIPEFMTLLLLQTKHSWGMVMKDTSSDAAPRNAADADADAGAEVGQRCKISARDAQL